MTLAQRRLLAEVHAGEEGYRPRYRCVHGGARIRMARRLVAQGLLVDHGHAFAGGTVFEITSAGRAALKKVDGRARVQPK